MLNAYDTVNRYFDALVSRDAETLISMMLPNAYFVKIGTDFDEVVEGVEGIVRYYKNHVASTEDFSITFLNLDIQERKSVAWFYTKQKWKLRWQGVAEEFVMRITGVLEKVDQTWKFAQIHASIGIPTS
ncbi:nuclear transport factor 2 family protein [Candidatus Poribacteria bacterium]|nr:nuclear transport factor 2 family protein [Candidatus Poribacteria bacterium]